MGAAEQNLVADGFVLDAFDQAAGAFQGLEDVAELDGFGGPAQAVAAAGSANAFDQLVDLEGDDDLFKIADGNRFFLGYAFENDGLPAFLVMTGQVDHQACAIAAFR